MNPFEDFFNRVNNGYIPSAQEVQDMHNLKSTLLANNQISSLQARRYGTLLSRIEKTK